MKKLIRNLALSAMVFMMVTSVAIAQEKPARERGKTKAALNLTEEQKALKETNEASLKASRAALEATFTAAQKEIAAKRDMAPMERRKALEATFTAEQKALSDKNREEARAAREKFQSSLTAEQKELMKERGLREGMRKGKK
jgi:hypothetical protein